MSKKEKEIKETAVEAAETVEKVKPKKNLKKLKFGSMSAVTIILVIAVVIAANIVCSLLTQRYPMKIDLTPDNRHEISQESIDALAAVDKDVEIIVTTTEDYFAMLGANYENMFYQYYGAVVECPYDIIPEILEKYSVYAEAGKGSIDVEYVNITKNPDVVTELNKYYNGEITEGGIVVKCGERVKYITPDEVVAMVTPSQNSTQTNIVMTFTGESVLTSAVKAVSDANPVRAAFVSSMNGSGIFDQTHSSIKVSLMNFMSKNGYDCVEIDIGTDALNTEDYDVIVVPAPSIDFTPDIITKLGDFLYNGGNYERDLIYVQNGYATQLPNISEFLAEWKIQIEPSIIIDNENMVQAGISAIGQMTYAPTLEIADTETVGAVANATLPIIAPQARPITVLSKNNETVVKEVIKSAASSELYTGEDEAGEKGAFNVVVKARKETSSGLEIIGSDVLVIGSPFMLDSAVLAGNNTYNNANVILNVINETTGKEASAVIPEKTFDQYTLSLTQGTARIILVVVVVVIPLLIGVAGLCVLLWRKNK
ncbi:MAG: GldG family protein [Ruminococcus sp.]|nr:GldG family protein [Ruminococcus sp.]